MHWIKYQLGWLVQWGPATVLDDCAQMCRMLSKALLHGCSGHASKRRLLILNHVCKECILTLQACQQEMPHYHVLLFCALGSVATDRSVMGLHWRMKATWACMQKQWGKRMLSHVSAGAAIVEYPAHSPSQQASWRDASELISPGNPIPGVPHKEWQGQHAFLHAQTSSCFGCLRAAFSSGSWSFLPALILNLQSTAPARRLGRFCCCWHYVLVRMIHWPWVFRTLPEYK